MNGKQFILYLTLITLLLVGAVVLQSSDDAEASNDFTSYNSTRLTSANASSTAGTRISGPGTFGSVVIIVPSLASTTKPTALGFYDGVARATSSATLLFTVPTTTPAGTYTFDVRVNNGLIVDVPRAYRGQAVITTRL